MTDATLDATVVIPCHTEDRWDELCAALRSALAQRPAPKAVVAAVDGNQALFARLQEWSSEIVVVLNTVRPGASATRNAGARIAETTFVAFLDDDATARPGWLLNLLKPFKSPEVVGSGGFVAPRWRVPAPKWFTEEFAWVIGASFRGLPTHSSAIRNVWSENMAVRREVFEQVGGFRDDFSKVGKVSRPEDTDLCIRMGKTTSDAKWMFVPEAIIDHDVGAERARFGFFVGRCYSEGRGKVELARHNDGRSDLADESHYLRQTLPQGFIGYARRGFRDRDRDELSRAGALVIGIVAAGLGAAIAAARGMRTRTKTAG